MSDDTVGQPKDFEELEKKINKKTKSDTKTIIQQIATRDKLERDYDEDILDVEFYSSPETLRLIKARRPTQEQMMTIMHLSAEAAIYEGKMDPTSLKKMLTIYEKLPELAAELTVDKKLDTEFWTKKVSFGTLQNFITMLIQVTQQGTGVSPEELKSFR